MYSDWRDKMERPPSVLFVVLIFSKLSVVTSKGIGPGEQDFGYVTVRPGAHMFWWLYHTSANVSDSADRPLILWLAGGPGSSSTGQGNFWRVGPVDEKLQPREHNWVKDYNILFVDNPVGAGFSYVENYRLLRNNNEEIARDLVETLKGFLSAVPKFKTTPFYIYGISYGGKMATDFALMLDNEIKRGNIECDLKALTMGNPWISSIDNTESYGRLLYQTGYVDEIGEHLIEEQARYVRQVYERGQYFLTRVEWVRTMELIDALTDGVDIYNLTTKVEKRTSAEHGVTGLFDKGTFEDKLNEKLVIENRDRLDDTFLFMNGPVREALGIPNHVVWSGPQTNELILNLYVEFMMPVTHSIERILNDTDLDVHVCNGNMDLIVPTTGVDKWINNLRWKDKAQYENANRSTIWVNNTMEGYEKHGGRLHFYWLNVASHDAITDSPYGTREFLRAATGV